MILVPSRASVNFVGLDQLFIYIHVYIIMILYLSCYTGYCACI